MTKQWYVYILLCGDHSFYCGCTNNLEKRVMTHATGKGAKYTRSRLPVKLIMIEKALGKSSALKREAQIKKMSRKQKIKMLYGDRMVIL